MKLDCGVVKRSDPPLAGSGTQSVRSRPTVGVLTLLVGSQLVQLESTNLFAVAQHVHLEYGTRIGGDFSGELERAETLFTTFESRIFLVRRGVIDHLAALDGNDGVQSGLFIRRTELADERLGVGENAVNDLVRHDGGGHAHIGDAQRFLSRHIHDVFIKDHKVGQLTFGDGADAIFHLVLISGADGHGMDGLQRVDAVIIGPELTSRGRIALSGFVVHGCVEVVAGSVDGDILLPSSGSGVA